MVDRRLRVGGLTKLLAGCLLGLAAIAEAQTTAANEWTWVGGSSTVPAQLFGESGVYGTLGTPAPGNVPGGRIEASSWTDTKGNLWLFGGGGLDANGVDGDLNDLWEFNPSTNEWTWMAGSNTQYHLGVYGTLGIPAAGNTPGSRDSAVSWTDNKGNLWLFGGYGLGVDANFGGVSLNDLWEFNPSTNEWAWISGSATGDNPGVYGTLGTSAPGNSPGGREWASGWTDSSGNLWLFGGLGFGAGDFPGALNDLWVFNPSTNEWTWAGGSSTVASSTGQAGVGVYGTLGTPAPGNIPGARFFALSWTGTGGDLWLFSGQAIFSRDVCGCNGAQGDLNDLWNYNPLTKEWTWMGGSNYLPPYSYLAQGEYGTLGTPAPGNIPSGLVYASSWTDSVGNFWLFGGDGLDPTGRSGALNDLWEFKPSTNEWTWMGGNSTVGVNNGQAGVYGVLGTPTPENIPGGREYASSWTDSRGNLWLFGGSGFDANGNQVTLNDLWVYQPPTPGFALAGTAVTVSPGATAGNTSTITVTPSGAFTGVISLSCAITPIAASDPATCSIPESITISGAAMTATLTVNTTAATMALSRTKASFWPSVGAAALAVSLCFRISTRRRRLQTTLGMFVLLVSFTCGALACAGGGNDGGRGSLGTTAGNYIVSVTGTSGAVTATGTIKLTVQ